MCSATQVFACLTVTFAYVVLITTSAPLEDRHSKLYKTPSLYDDMPSVFKTKRDTVNGTSVNPFSKFTCDACVVAVGILQRLFKEGKEWDDIVVVLGDFCYLFKIEDKKVCKSITEEFKDEILTVVRDVALNPKELCGVLIGDKCGAGYDPWDQEWNVSIPGNKPPVRPVPTPPEGSPKIRILQISDMHYDPLYTPGHTSQCGEPLCCRKDDQKVTDNTAAGYWGDYNCDVPLHTLNNLMEHLFSVRDKFDWVYWTGDLPAHNVWNQSRNDQLTIMKEMVDLMKKFLPDKLVFPTFGNHESSPVNSFPPPFITGELSLDWLLEPTLGYWSYWLGQLPDWPSAAKTIKRGGFYNVKVREGLRVISLQTNYCNTGNFWLLINSTDPNGHLQWLIEQLLQAEQKGEKVHILGHIPPSVGDCNKVYARNYRKIVNRFESTIIGQFFGHTHTDFFEVFFEENSTRATNVLFVSPGVTSYHDLNLGYRIYTIDGNRSDTTHALLDHETYYLNLTKANALPPTQIPQWEFEYSLKDAFHMQSLQPADWADLVDRMNASDELFTKFFNFLTKMHSPASFTPADKANNLCATVTTVNGDLSHCKSVLPEGMTLDELMLYSSTHRESMC